MKKNTVEIIVGLYVLAGIIFISYLSIKLGRVELFSNNRYYPVHASFTSVAGLKKDVNVEVAGVRVGSVKTIALKDNQASVTLAIENDIKLQDDSIASIKSKGLLGEKYIVIEPGYSDEIIESDGEIFDTEPSFDLEGILKHLAVGDD